MNEVQPTSNEDLIVWPDGTLCYREHLPEMTHMSDDYEVVPLKTPRWFALLQADA